MVRLFNYLAIAFAVVIPLTEAIQDDLLLFVTRVAVLIALIVLLDFVSFEDNLTLSAFLVSMPFILYLIEQPAPTLPAFLGIVFLALAIPTVLVFLFFELANVPVLEESEY